MIKYILKTISKIPVTIFQTWYTKDLPSKMFKEFNYNLIEKNFDKEYFVLDREFFGGRICNALLVCKYYNKIYKRKLHG